MLNQEPTKEGSTAIPFWISLANKVHI